MTTPLAVRLLRAVPSTLLALALVAGLAVGTLSTSRAGVDHSSVDQGTAADLEPAAWVHRSTAVRSSWHYLYSTSTDSVSRSQLFRASVMLRAYGRATRTYLQIYQVYGGHVVTYRTAYLTALHRGYRTLRVAMYPRYSGGYVAVRVRSAGYPMVAVRNVSVTRTTALAAPAGCVSNIQGLPATGTAYAGSAATGDVSLAARESSYGRRLGVHRTYWGPTQVASAVRSASEDVAYHRLPWISFKLPGTWAQMAAGTYDRWALDLVNRLDDVRGPVWIAFHHEPEGQRTTQRVSDWTRMQARLLRMVHDHSDNVATSIIVMGYHQVYGTDPSLKLAALWPGDGLVDVIGADPYNFYSTRKPSGAVITEMTDMRPTFSVFHAFAAAHHARWGLAETGYTDQAAAKNANWLLTTYAQLRAYGGSAMSYFDSTLNTGGYSWTLDLLSKRTSWAAALRASARIC